MITMRSLGTLGIRPVPSFITTTEKIRSSLSRKLREDSMVGICQWIGTGFLSGSLITIPFEATLENLRHFRFLSKQD